MDSILPLLRDADFFVLFVCNAVILGFAFGAYKRTKKIAFVLFAVASATAIVESAALYRYGSARAGMSQSEREHFQAVCRIVVMITGIMTTAATVFLIRHISPTIKSDT